MRGAKRRCGDRSKTISDCRHEIRWVVFSSIYCAFCCSALKLCWWSLCLDWWMICLRIQSQWFGVCSWSGEQFQKIKSWFNLPLFSYAFVHSDSFAISSCVCVCVFCFVLMLFCFLLDFFTKFWCWACSSCRCIWYSGHKGFILSLMLIISHWSIN